MGKKLELAGKKFGRLTVIEEAARGKKKQIRWLCRCDCGNETIVQGSNLHSGSIVSCGCYKAEQTGRRFRKHGYGGTRVYNSWDNMCGRCNDTHDLSYARYGARGISVCARWLSFDNFLEDMKEPEPGMSLDRINNDGNYEPSNCRWATRKEQARNRRSNVRIEWQGETMILIEWAERLNIKFGTLKSRFRRGWSVKRAFTTPVQVHRAFAISSSMKSKKLLDST